MTLEHPDHKKYKHFTRRQRFDTAIQTLSGLLHGIAIDNKLNADEVAEVVNWSNEYRDLIGRAPFDEIIPKLDQVLEDGFIDNDEQEDILWVCKNLSTQGNFYNDITQRIQQLHGILHGILADNYISKEEAERLQEWQESNSSLKGTYPYDEVESILLEILKDGKIDEEEQIMLRRFFDDFIEYSFSKQVKKEIDRIKAGIPQKFTLPSVCHACPEISFDGRTFTFTGSSDRGTRDDLASIVEDLGGEFSRSLTQKTEFLVVGSAGNPCWTFTCYGRKIEKAVELRKQGHLIIIVHESDFWDAVKDQGVE